MRPIPELLSPAGDEAALRAAVDQGANAVYLGCKAFGARASAANFDGEGLRRAVEYAHLYHVRIHVTVNTLVKEGELPDAEETLRGIVETGADAVIVQDLGVAKLARERFPALALHASTQMALSNASDARFARDFGFSRVVLARECSLNDILRVAETGVETEVFAHGALCTAVSGRCLMSSMAGGRSGNRGRCAQPCRQRLSMNGQEGALLSLRDLCAWEDLPGLIGAGVTALKIEGRLKSPEYVAEVTSVYREALDRIGAGTFDPEDPRPKERLLQIFNRGGFTRGHAFGAEDADLASPREVSHQGVPLGQVTRVKGGLASIRLDKPLHDGDSLRILDGQEADLRYAGHDAAAGETALLRLRPEMRVGTGSLVNRLCDARQLAAAREHVPKAIPIVISARFREGQPMELTVNDGQSTVTVCGEAPGRAQTRAAGMEEVRGRLSKVGDTPFSLAGPDSVTVELGEGLFLPVSALNALRREALEQLRMERIRAFGAAKPSIETAWVGGTAKPERTQPETANTDTRQAFNAGVPSQSETCAGGKAAPSALVNADTLVVSFSDPELARDLLTDGATMLWYRPRSYRPADLENALDALPAGTWLELPVQCEQDALDALKPLIHARGERLGGLVANSLGQLSLCPDMPVILGDAVPVTNREAAAALRCTSAQGFVLWPEWTYQEQKAFAPYSLPALAKVYGRERLMVLNHCPERVRRGLTVHRESCGICADPSMACGVANAEMKDRKGYRFPLTRTVFPRGCRLSVWNALPTDLRAFDGERRGLGAGMLIAFTTESPAEQRELTRLFAALHRGETIPPAENATAGHWRRGVE